MNECKALVIQRYKGKKRKKKPPKKEQDAASTIEKN
jgi:hypothetical protein